MPHCSDSSSLSSLKDKEQSNILFPELNVPELDLQLTPPDFHPLPCYKKTEPLKSISTILDYDLDKFFAIAQAKTSMPIETPQIFHGDGRASENPADFLKSFNCAEG
jgi:hypothetical protein